MRVYEEGRDLSKSEKEFWWVGFELQCPRCSCRFDLEEKDQKKVFCRADMVVVKCPNGTCQKELVIDSHRTLVSLNLLMKTSSTLC